MLSKSSHCVKYLLIFFNLVFVITGIVLIGVGATVLGYYRTYDMLLEHRYISAAQLLIATGSIILIVAFFGCCGAAKENYCMTMTFAGFLILICILELGAGIAGYVLRNDAKTAVDAAMMESFNDRSKTEENQKMWTQMQLELHCCGANNSTDYYPEPLPASCCGHDDSSVCDKADAYGEGCTKAFITYVEDHALSIGGVGIGIAFIQFVGIILSCCLARAIHSEYETV